MHQEVLQTASDIQSVVAADHPQTGGPGRLQGILQILLPILEGILQGLRPPTQQPPVKP
jgi:hypothetical protein